MITILISLILVQTIDNTRVCTKYVDCIVLKRIKNNTVIEETYVDMDTYIKAIEALKIAEQEIIEHKKEIRRLKISSIIQVS
ncbi:hypothetical protein [Cytophaga hutchinsonii]|nr:hypothetical protein [Cytophaga hutchinsonii]